MTIGSPGLKGTTTLTITPTGGFNQTITFNGASCSGLPSGATGTFGPADVIPNGGAVSTTLTITTTAASAAIQHWRLEGKQTLFFALLDPVLLIMAEKPREDFKKGERRDVSGVGFADRT